jgi:hypothetical protein
MNGMSYTPEMIKFLEDNALKHNSEILGGLFNKRFNTNIEPQSLRRAMKLRNIEYIKGHKLYETKNLSYKRAIKPLGHEWFEKRKGTTYIKISNEGSRQDRWKPKHYFLWKKTHGSIPKNHRVIFLDNNIFNFELDNLELVSPIEFILLRKYGFHSNNKEVTKAGLAIVRHRLATLRAMTKGMSEEEKLKAMKKLSQKEWRQKK